MFEWDGEAYRKHSDYQTRVGLELIDRLAPADGEHILDVGCGAGRLTLEIAARVPNGRVLGIDASAAMLATAERGRRERNAANVSFRLQDARDLDEEAAFDAVYSNAVLHWIPDHPDLLRRFFRALRPGGRMALGFGGRGNAAPLQEVLDDLMARTAYAPYFKDWRFPWLFPEAPEYQTLVEEAGFAEVEAEGRQVLVDFDPAGFRGWFQATHMPYWSRLPEDLTAGFIDAAVEAYYRRQGQALTVPFVRLVVRCQRPPSWDEAVDHEQ